MQKKLINILFLLTMLAFGNSAQAKLFNGEEFYLDNGLRVIVIPNHRAPIVKHMVWYKAGSIAAPEKSKATVLMKLWKPTAPRATLLPVRI